jgi:hypothetical protein
MTEEQLIEKMARAMAKDANDHFDQARLFYMRRATAALAAIREAGLDPFALIERIRELEAEIARRDENDQDMAWERDLND